LYVWRLARATDAISEPGQQRDGFIKATVDIANDIERAAFFAAVVP
jgi:hypothetical protein